MVATECPSLETLDRYVTDAGNVHDAGSISRHVTTCESCRRTAERIRVNLAFISLLTSDGSGPPTDPSPIVSSATTRPALSLAGYEILHELHRGGQGVVYKALQKTTHRTVALKVLLHGVLASERQRRRFEREIDIAASLQHPGIVTVHDSGQTDDGRHFFAMEYIEGAPLDEHFAGSRATGAVLSLFIEIARAVSHAHQRGVIHRDLKPSNILVTPDGVPRIVDFGLAKAAGPGALATLPVTCAGEFMGTLAYASPEHVSGNPDRMDVRSDVYSLGVMLYESLTGCLPYPMTGALDEIVRSIKRSEPRSLRSPHGSRIAPDLDAVVRRALAKRLDDRYESAAAFADDLERVRAGRAVDARPRTLLYIVRKTMSRHPAWSVAIALAVVFVLVTAIAANIVAAQRRTIIDTLEDQALERDARLAVADARREALGYYHQAVDLIGRGVREPESRALLDRAIEIDSTLSAAYLERGVLKRWTIVRDSFSRKGHRVAATNPDEFIAELRATFSDLELAHVHAGGDWLTDPTTGIVLSPAEARERVLDETGLPDGERWFPDVVALPDGSLVRVDGDGGRTPVGGPGLPRALFSAGNFLAAYLSTDASGLASDRLLAKEMIRYYRRAAALDPNDVYANVSPALAAARQPHLQGEAVIGLRACVGDPRAAALVEVWQAVAEVHLGGPRILIPEFHPELDPPRAEAAARRAIALSPFDEVSWYLLGAALLAQERYEESAAASERALLVQERTDDDIDPSATGDAATRWEGRRVPYALVNLAKARAAMGRFDEAWPLFEDAIISSVRAPIVLLARSEAYQHAGLRAEAIADIEEAFETNRGEFYGLMPNTLLPTAWFLLTMPDETLRDPERARWLLDRFRKDGIFTNDPTAIALEMLALVELGEPEAAIALWTESGMEDAAGDAPVMTDAVLTLAFGGVGDPARAREHRGRVDDAVRGRPLAARPIAALLDRTRASGDGR